jgi:hypothetical protein
VAYLVSILNDDPGKNAMLVCDEGKDHIAIPVSLERGYTTQDEVNYITRMVPFNDQTWQNVDQGKLANVTSTLNEFDQGGVVEFQSCNLFIDDWQFFKDNVKLVGDAAINVVDTMAEINPLTHFIPGKDEMAESLKSKFSDFVDKTVDGTREAYAMDETGLKNVCAFVGDTAGGNLMTPFPGAHSPNQDGDISPSSYTLEMLNAQGLCTTEEEKASYRRGADGIDLIPFP